MDWLEGFFFLLLLSEINIERDQGMCCFADIEFRCTK